MAGRARRRLTPAAAIVAFVVVLGLWNAYAYPPGKGYDAAEHIAYADGLVPGWNLPHGTGEYYTPPGFYVVAGSLDWVGRQIGLGEPHRLLMALQVFLLAVTTTLVLRIARLLWPGRERLALASAAFVALIPVTVKSAAMFHPEMLDACLATLAIWLCILLLRRGWSLLLAGALGVTLGCGQLVRAFSLWTLAVVLVTLAVARRPRELAVVLLLAVVLPAPWYIHQRLTYDAFFPFNQPTPSKPIVERRPLAFYVDPGLPDSLVRPYRPHFTNLALPTVYNEIWGDYFGHWAWDGTTVSPGVRHRLVLQSAVGIAPTLVALAGWLLLLLSSLRSPPRLAIALVPLLGLVGFLYFTVSYPTPNGNVLKGSYMLTTISGWAIGFGYALDRLRGRPFVALTTFLAVCAVAELPFLVY